MTEGTQTRPACITEVKNQNLSQVDPHHTRAIITLVILANYESIMWHRSAYPIISQLRLSLSHKLVVKGQAR